MNETGASEPRVLLRVGVSFVGLVAGWAAANLLFQGWMVLGWATHGMGLHLDFVASWLLITGVVSVASWLVVGLPLVVLARTRRWFRTPVPALVLGGALGIAVYGLLGLPLGIYPLIRNHHDLFYASLFLPAFVTAAGAAWLNAVLLNLLRKRARR